MDRQGFEPLAKVTLETVKFMENIEMLEDFGGNNKNKIAKATMDAKKGNSNKAKKNNNT